MPASKAVEVSRPYRRAELAGFRFCSPRRLKTKNRFAFLHQIQTITRNRFQVGHVGLEQIDLASLARQQSSAARLPGLAGYRSRPGFASSLL